MGYTVGRMYVSERSGEVIYRGYEETLGLHEFELKHMPGAMRYAGEPPETSPDAVECFHIGDIYEYMPTPKPKQQSTGQSKRWSLIETICGVIIGFAVALIIQIIIFPLFGITTSFGENFTIAGVFTVASIVRGYYVRRLFSWMRNVKGIGS